MIKSLFRLSLHIVTGFVQSLIRLCGLTWIAPYYSTLCRRQKHIDIQISYEKSCNGLHILVDSTGLKFLGEGEWKRKKHQPEYRRQWFSLFFINNMTCHLTLFKNYLFLSIALTHFFLASEYDFKKYFLE
jgi:hypothetical protein